jgi:hypothetical protein
MKETDGVEVDLMSVMKTEESQVLIIIISEEQSSDSESKIVHKTLRIMKKTRSIHKIT